MPRRGLVDVLVALSIRKRASMRWRQCTPREDLFRACLAPPLVSAPDRCYPVAGCRRCQRDDRCGTHPGSVLVWLAPLREEESMQRTSLLIALVGIAAAAHATDVYKWTDASGVVHYADSEPPAEAKAERVHVVGMVTAAPTTAKD